MSLKMIPFETIELKSRDPMKLFQIWREESAQLPNNAILDGAMTLATVKSNGSPSARNVLLRGSDDKGYKIFTDYRSSKGMKIAADNRAALVHLWIYQTPSGEMGYRQVRIEGLVEKLSVEESQDYFNSEPITAQIRAFSTHQFKIITDNRECLRVESQKLLDMYNADPENFKIAMPNSYGGYRLVPNMMEFYQGSRDAFNDRVRFRKLNGQKNVMEPGVTIGDNNWCFEQLEP